MQAEEIQITTGENLSQNAGFEPNDKMIDYETSKSLSYGDIISIYKGLNVISEFYDVLGAATVTPIGICAVSLGKTLEEAVINVMDSNPIDFMQSTIVLSNEVDSDIAKMLKETHIVAAPKFTKNAIEYFETHDKPKTEKEMGDLVKPYALVVNGDRNLILVCNAVWDDEHGVTIQILPNVDCGDLGNFF